MTKITIFVVNFLLFVFKISRMISVIVKCILVYDLRCMKNKKQKKKQDFVIIEEENTSLC